MSNTIGFSNFRRFVIFPEIDLCDITILVGGNNAGKSTLVKAMLLMRDFLKSRIESSDNSKINNNLIQRPQFSFDSEHVNVGDFYRAFCHNSPKKENTISFKMKIESFRFIVNIRGERKPGVMPELSMIAVSDEYRNIAFTFDFSNSQMIVKFGKDADAYKNTLFNEKRVLLKTKEELTATLKDLNIALSESKDFEKITSIKYNIEKTQSKLRQIESELYNHKKNSRNDDYVIKIFGARVIEYYFYNIINAGKLIIPELIKGFVRFAEEGTLGDMLSKSYKEEEANKTFLRGKAVELKAIAEELETILNKQVIEYIYAHSVNQNSVYANCANSSDYTKRTIHEFYTSKISQGDEEFLLIEKWLNEFKIGKSLKVIPYKGDNYSLVIFDNENPEISSEKRKGYPGGIDLADKGMGSIQIVILLLRLATLIRKNRGQQLTILLEEPEQNLHPSLQSKLADLINEVNRQFGLRFIVETHSEYLVRHSQVLAAKQIYEESVSLKDVNESIKVYYISQERGVVDMLFMGNAKFQDFFDEGFFDQSARESLTISRLERLNKSK